MDDTERGTGGPDERELTPTEAAELKSLLLIVWQLAMAYVRRTVGAEQAQDIAQIICTSIWRQWLKKPAEFARPAYVKGYVATAARRCVVDFLRDRAARRVRDGVFGVAYQRAALQSMNTQLVVEARDLHRRVVRALRAMSRPRRDVFLFHRKDGLSYAEIAKRRGISPKTVQHHMANATEELTDALRESPKEDTR